MGNEKDGEMEPELGMKVSKNVSIELGLLVKVLKIERHFSKAVTEALEDWLKKKRWTQEEYDHMSIKKKPY